MTKMARRDARTATDFQVKLATKAEEVEAAQRLRFEVFNREMGRGLSSSSETGLDRDEYDSCCDHLLVVDTQCGSVVGTYRLLLRSRLKKGLGFYSEREFDLSRLKLLKDEVLETGRSCVRRDYRSHAVLHLLWAGILSYARKRRVRYIIGCPSLYTRDATEISEACALMRRFYAAGPEFSVAPRPECRVRGLDSSVSVTGREKEIRLKIPSLLRSYLKIGARVCGDPAADEAFGTVDFFILLDVSVISQAYLARLGIASVSPRV